MTSPTHDKEWKIIEDKHKGVVYSEGNDKIGYNFCYVEKTLLDQLRRDAKLEAKKELLDEIEEFLGDCEYDNNMCGSPQWKELRAKTLGEK